MRYYTLDSYPGCSGSAIYAVDGSIIGLITYGNSETAFDGLERIPGAIGFELNFSPKVLAKISK
jgi:V8-like Glu-specific endopeptidase